MGTAHQPSNTFGPNGLLSRNVSGTSTFYTFDPQGSVAQRFDRTGNLLSSDEYDAFGVLKGQTPSQVGDVFRYGAQWGYQTDNETGLLLLTSRYYDPGTGRFLNRDPLSYAGGANLYGYAGNNPSSYADPLGLVSRAQYVAGGGAVGAVGGAAVGGGLPGAAILGGYGALTGGQLYDAADAFGTAYGCYEGGYASLWQVTKSGFGAAVNVLGTALFIGGVVSPALAPAPGAPAPGGVHIDIGGEGRYPEAINVNIKTTATDGSAIPNLVMGRGESLPFRPGSAGLVTVESTPLRPGAAGEIAGVVSSGGKVVLFHPEEYAAFAHQGVIDAVGGTFHSRR